MTLSILHISDLHRDSSNPIGNQVLLDSLERDRERYTSKEDPRICAPNFIIVSGDIVQGVMHGTVDGEAKLKRQYEEAVTFLNDLTDRFVGGDKSRIVVVPGNHDVSDQKFRESLVPVNMSGSVDRSVVQQLFRSNSAMRWSWNDLSLLEIENWETYKQRFDAFTQFYEDFYEHKRSYSSEPDQQLDLFDCPDLGICVVGFCSCHSNDLLNRQGSIHPDCVADANTKLRSVARSHNPVRIAVWHHNTEGPPAESDYMDPDVVQNFIDGGFSLGFHGHQHRPQYLDTRFRHGPDRRIQVISAGTLCGGAAFRFGRAYNIVEIDVEGRSGRLHVREMQNDNLQLPIWGVRALPPNRVGYLDFEFDDPPVPFTKPDRVTVELAKAQELFEDGSFQDAATILSALLNDDDLARPLLLQCYLRLGDHAAVTRTFDPPASPAEVIALMDALWDTGDRERLSNLLKTSFVSESEDVSISEMREKYLARLSK
ncbi:MAG: metallophosphoesterase [Pseudomonadales bacterium]